VTIFLKVLSLGRLESNTFSLDDQRISGKHFEVILLHLPDNKWGFTLYDSSRNGTWVNNKHVHNTDSVLDNGAEIVVLPGSKVGIADVLSFRFYTKWGPPEDGDVNLPCGQPNDPTKPFQVSLATQLTEEMSCGICADVLYKPLCIVPCLHNLCSVCFLEWAVSKKGSAIDCPICRTNVKGARPNHQLRSILATFLKSRPDKGHNAQEIWSLEEKEKKLRTVMAAFDTEWDLDNCTKTNNPPSARHHPRACCIS